MQAQHTLSPSPQFAPQHPAITHDCPKCASPETRSFEMTYLSNTSTGSLVAGSYNFSGGGATITTGKLSQQSNLAGYVQPPIAPTMGMGLVIVGVVIALFFGMFLMGNLIRANYAAFGLFVMLGLPIFAGYQCYRYEKIGYLRRFAVFNSQLEQWRASWICMRCGHRWYRR